MGHGRIVGHIAHVLPAALSQTVKVKFIFRQLDLRTHSNALTLQS